MDIASMIPLAAGLESPGIEHDELETEFSQTIAGIRAAQKKAQEDFQSEYEANREAMRRMMHPPRIGAATLELQELSVLLQQNPAIVPTVLTFAKTVIANIQATIQSQLAASLPPSVKPAQ